MKTTEKRRREITRCYEKNQSAFEKCVLTVRMCHLVRAGCGARNETVGWLAAVFQLAQRLLRRRSMSVTDSSVRVNY